MRRISSVLQLSAICVASGLVIACKPEQSFETPSIQAAGVRFINAVPDTQALDFRFVDEVENSAHWGVRFRNNPTTQACVTGSTGIQFKPAEVGERHFRIFLSDTIQAHASQFLKDTTVNLEEGRLYTALLWGYARPGGGPPMRLTFMEETAPDPGAQVAIRVLNATATAIDVRHYVGSTTSNQVPVAATWSDVPPMSVSDYVMVPPSLLRFNVQDATGTTLLSDVPALPGSPPPAPGFDAIAGTNVAGSAITAVVFALSDTTNNSKADPTAPFRPSTGSTNLSASALGFSRAAGSFINDCFFVGGTVNATGFSVATNNGAATVTGITPSRTTGSRTMAAIAGGYTRATGDFVADGFEVDMFITASGFDSTANNGASRITAVTPTTLTVAKATPPIPEAAAAGRTIVSHQLLRVTRAVPLVANAGAANRTVAGEVPGVFTTFMWDRRPPRS